MADAEFRQWLEGCPAPKPPVELLRVEDGALVLAFHRPSGGDRVATVTLAPVEGSTFFAEGLEDPPDEVEEWLTEVNGLMSEKSRMTWVEAVGALLAKAPSRLGLSAAARADEEDEEMEPELEDDEDDDAMIMAEVEAGRNRAQKRLDFSEEQKWDGMVAASASRGSRQASQVLMREMRTLLALQAEGGSKAFEIEMVEDNLYQWCVKLHADGFPEGNALAGELRAFASRHPSGVAAVVMEAVFPDSYPMEPPFIRVVRPRFQMHTGHITVGGSVCMQLLTPSGWLPSVSLENVFVSIRSEMIEGDGRLDPHGGNRDYTSAEAREAFSRVASRYGWLKR